MGQPQVITKDGKRYYDGGAAGLIPAEDIEGPPAPGMFERGLQMVQDAAPALVAGGVGFLGGGPLGMGAAGAATEAYREYRGKSSNPDTPAAPGDVSPGMVGFQGALNMLPWAANKGYSALAGRGTNIAADTAIGAAGGGMRGAATSALKAIWRGLGAAEGPALEKGAPDAISGMQLPDGTPLVSEEGLKYLRMKALKLANPGSPISTIVPGQAATATGVTSTPVRTGAQKALEDLMQQVKTRMPAPDMGALLDKAGVTASTAEQRAADLTAQAVAAAKEKALRGGRFVQHALSTVLSGMGGAGMTGQDQQ